MLKKLYWCQQLIKPHRQCSWGKKGLLLCYHWHRQGTTVSGNIVTRGKRLIKYGHVSKQLINKHNIGFIVLDCPWQAHKNKLFLSLKHLNEVQSETDHLQITRLLKTLSKILHQCAKRWLSQLGKNRKLQWLSFLQWIQLSQIENLQFRINRSKKNFCLKIFKTKKVQDPKWVLK